MTAGKSRHPEVAARERALRRLRLAEAALRRSAEGLLVADARGALVAANPASGTRPAGARPPRTRGSACGTASAGRGGGAARAAAATTARRIERVAKACVEALAVPLRIDGNDVRISASIGVSVSPTHGCTVDALVASADRAMHVARRAGGSRVTLAEKLEREEPPPSPASREEREPVVRASAAGGTRPTRAAGRRGRSPSRRRA